MTTEEFYKQRGIKGTKVNNLTPGQQMTQGFEGYKENVYIDSEGYPTIGAGSLIEHTKYDEVPEHLQNLRLPYDQGGAELFQKEYNIKAGEVGRKYGEGWDKVPSDVKDIMIDLGFNLGTEGLYEKFPGFVSDIREGDYASAAGNLKYKDPSLGDVEGNISSWYEQVGGTKYESRVSEGKYSSEALKENRATRHYNTLLEMDDPVEMPATDYLINTWNAPSSIEG